MQPTVELLLLMQYISQNSLSTCSYIYAMPCGLALPENDLYMYTPESNLTKAPPIGNSYLQTPYTM